MSMKPRLDDTNKKITPNMQSGPNTHPGQETGEVSIPGTVSCKHDATNSGIPGSVTKPKTH